MTTFATIAFDTNDLPATQRPEDRSRRWIDIMQRAGCDVDLDLAPDDAPFAGRLEMARGERVLLGVTRTTCLKTARSRSKVAQTDDDDIMLLLNCGQTPIQGQQFGHEIIAMPGAAMAFTMGSTLSTHARFDNEIVGIKLPVEVLSSMGIAVETVACRLIDRSLPHLQILADYARFVAREAGAFDLAGARVAEQHLTELVGICLGADSRVRDMADASATARARMLVVCSFIRQRLGDPALSIHDLALHLGTSVRSVQHMLALHDTSFTEQLTLRRSARARSMLLDPAFDDLPVADIAIACGFTEITSLYRAFRQIYDATPASIRKLRHGPTVEIDAGTS